MPEPLIPARYALAADGTPYSDAYDDVYHSAAGGPEQARHVFLGGNGLPARWAGRERFVILETGFGFGLNFLATWQAWRDDARRPAQLHYVSIEKHPFERADLAALHARYPGLAPLAQELQARWPPLVPGMQRLSFAAGRVLLTLAFADVARALAELRLAADAIYLDGFSPAKNPAMWSPATLRRLARLAAPGASAATWSAASGVRAALEDGGFSVEKRAGFSAKREMIVATRRPGDRGKAPAAVSTAKRAALAPPAQRAAVVIGAGIAGASAAERLCARGWSVVLLEREAGPARGASGNHAASFHPLLTPDDSIAARIARASFLAALAHWQALESAGHALRWDRCGVLQLARAAREESAMRAALAALRPPPEYAQYATRDEASAHAGVAVGAGGLWFPQAGWVDPRSLVGALLAACGARLDARYGVEAAALAREAEGCWSVRDAAGAVLARAPVVVLANAHDALRLAPPGSIELRRVRGQLSHLRADATPQAASFDLPHVVLLRGGFVLPAIDGIALVGASYDLDDDDPQLREESQAGNLERLARLLPEADIAPQPLPLAGRVGFRAVSADRLPLAGALPDTAALERAPASLAALPRIAGLYAALGYASRGILWSSLAAELLAATLEQEPLPVEASLADALDPGRFALRRLRRGIRSGA